MTTAPNNAPTESTKLGTFGGVFAPSLLTILGLVLFLRLGFVTGNIGLVKMLLVLGLSVFVSLLTTISLAAIATNLKVRGGGVYFLISRTLGPAFGGAIGLVLYVAMSVSIAFYTIGLGEAVASVVGSESSRLPRIIAAATILALLGLAWLGADIATRLQYLVMMCLALAIVGYFVGVVGDLDFGRVPDNLWAPPGGDSFWVSFAIFFPAITGFTQGVAMSGDLRTPSRSISVGTFGAIGISTIVYLLVIATLVMAVPLAELQDDTAIMRRLAVAPWVIDVGVIAATLSSAIASIMGAPRTLQRLAADRLVKPLEPFAVGSGRDDNPRRGAVLSAAIALLAVALGDLDVVAPVISMFFLASYGMINYATYSEARAASTSFRPRFRFFDWRLSLAGTIACLAVILAIDPIAGGLAGVAVFGLYRYLRGSVHQVRWADSTRGFHTSEVRSHLKLMGTQADWGRDWRPCTVAFVPRDPRRRARLTAVGSWFEGEAGFTTVARIVAGHGALVRKRAARIELELRRELSMSDQTIYGRVIVAETLESGVAAMLQAHGIGALRANLALYSWYDFDELEGPSVSRYGTMVQTGIRFGCSVGIVHATEETWARIPKDGHEHSRIAVWWHDDRTGQLLTMLAWMCTRGSIWQNAAIEVWIGGNEVSLDEINRIAARLHDARLPARVMGSARPGDFTKTVATAGLVFAPVRIRQGEVLGPGDAPIDTLVDDLPVVVFAHAAATVELDLQPDDTNAAALAAAEDRATALTVRAEELSQEAGTLLVTAELLRMELAPTGTGTDEKVLEAAEAATRAHRKYVDARARAEEAWRIVRGLDPTVGTDTLDPELWLGSVAKGPTDRNRR